MQVSATSHTPAAARQTAPAFPGVCWQPTPGVQLSIVQGLPSSQFRGVPTHTPLWQVSPVVHTLSPSVQGVPFTVPAQVTVNKPVVES